jgi:hypothetical protein
MTEAKLKSGSKKNKLKDENPGEELYKFPTLGQISKMTVESNPLAAHVRSKSGKKKKVVEHTYGIIDSDLKDKSFISDQSPRSVKVFDNPTLEKIEDFDQKILDLK